MSRIGSLLALSGAPPVSLRNTLVGLTLALVGPALLTVSMGCATPAPKTKPLSGEIATDGGTPYRVGPSDQLSIRVLPDPAIERTALVRPDGMFSMDLIGDVSAVGRTTDEIAREIEERIAEYRLSPEVTVSVEEIHSTAISVLGEVGDPSSFPLERVTRVSEAVALAGGASQLAATSRIRIVRRQGGETVTYFANLDRIQGGDASTDFVLEKGDLVYVPAAYPVVGGYALRRVIYPLEVLMQTIAGPLLGLAVAQ